MHRRTVVLGGAASAMLAGAGVLAQQPGRVARIGLLAVDRKDNAERLKERISRRLGERGWHEGGNLTIDLRHADKAAQTGELAASLVATSPDLLIAVGPYPAHSLRDATRSIPIVLLWVADPVGRGLVPKLSRPGGNITGVTHFVGSGGMMVKVAELLKEMLPHATRVAVLINPANPIYSIRREDVDKTWAGIEQTHRVTTLFVEVRTVAQIPAAFDSALEWRAQALIVTADSVLGSARGTIVALANKHKLPAIYPDSLYVQQGGLISYSASFWALLDRAIAQVDKILRGANPGDLPVEQPTTFILAVNSGTAKALGIEFPPSVLLRADRVIE